MNTMSVQCMSTSSHHSVDERCLSLVRTKIDDTRNVLDDIQHRLERQLKLQEQLMCEQNEVMTSQDQLLNGFQEKLSSMAEEVLFTNHMSGLYDRLLDDHDQISRKVNLRLDGVELLKNENAEIILKYIQNQVKASKVRVEDDEYDTAYRLGPVYLEENKQRQRVLLRMRCCLGRNEIFMNRHRLPFTVSLDLTAKREEILEFARVEIGKDVVKGVMDDVYVDMDCKLQVKTKCGRTFGFSSREEFLSLFSRLSGSDCNGGKCRCYDVD